MKRFMVLFLLLTSTVAFSQKKKQAGTDPTNPKNPANHWVGTYKLDVAQSKIGGQPPQEETVAVSAATKDSVKYTIQGKDAQGNSYTMNYEGKVGTASPPRIKCPHRISSLRRAAAVTGHRAPVPSLSQKTTRRSPCASIAKIPKALSTTRRWFTFGSKKGLRQPASLSVALRCQRAFLLPALGRF